MYTLASLGKQFSDGGIWMWFILAAQITSIVIIVERSVYLFLRHFPTQKDKVKSFEHDIKKGELETVLSKAQALGANDPLGIVIQAGTQAALDMGGREEIQARMDEILMQENARLERRIGFLPMLGNVGTLLGLLGTIVGLIIAFGSVANVNAAEKAVMLTQGVAMAMITTAYGLIMAIPALVLFAILQNRANRLAEDLNDAATKAFNWLSFNYETLPRKRISKK